MEVPSTPAEREEFLARRRVGRWRWHRPSGRAEYDADALRLLGARPGETGEQAWQRVVHPADLERLEEAGRRLEEAATFRVHAGDGPPRYLLSRLLGEDPAALEPGWMTGAVLDVTEAREGDLRAAVALERMTDAFIACDGEFRVTHVNRSAQALLLRRYDELVGKTIWEEFPFLVGTLVEDSYRRAATTGEVVTFEWPGAHEGTWFTSDVHPSPEGLFIYMRDTTARHDAQRVQAILHAELEHRATHDPLTGLGNSDLAQQWVERRAARGEGAALVCVGVDRFMLVNDALGRARSDALLRQVAARLVEVVGPHGDPDSLVARASGDEFLLLLPAGDDERVRCTAARALAAIRDTFTLGREQLDVTASAGMAVVAAGTPDAFDVLVREAGIALHASKRTGRDRATWCDSSLKDDVARRARVERDLRAALADPDQLHLHYQPSFSLASGLPAGVEALLRWRHPALGPVPPGEVIPVAEDSGLVLPLGEWVIATAAAQARAWAGVPDFTTWFNVAPRQLASGDVPGALVRTLERTGVAPERLGVEVTESVLADGSPAGAALEAVRALGVKIAIDDFGTGYSSLSRLLAFPVDLVKIDRSFVVSSGSPEGAAVLAGIVDLAHGLGASVIAEGVETWDQLAAVRATACDSVSGFLLGRPVPAADQPLRRARFAPPAQHPRSAPLPR